MKPLWMRAGALCVVIAVIIVMVATMPQHHDTVDMLDDSDLDKPSGWAYIQGWGDYESMYISVPTNIPTIHRYVLKNSSRYMDSLASKGRLTDDYSILYVDCLDPTEIFSGYNISDATIYRVDGSSFILPLDPTYTENVKYRVNMAVVLWNLDQNVKGYRFANDIYTDTGSRNFREYYHAYMDALDESERITAWHIFESRRCAYDMELPVIQSLQAEGHNLTLHATDNVGIARVEWYVNDVLHTSLPISSPSVVTSLDLSSLTLASGQTAIVMCRVYDFEGVQTGDRPRSKRYVEKKERVKIPAIQSPVSPLVELVPFSYDQHIDESDPRPFMESGRDQAATPHDSGEETREEKPYIEGNLRKL